MNSPFETFSFELGPVHCRLAFYEKDRKPFKFFRISERNIVDEATRLGFFAPTFVKEMVLQLKAWFENPMLTLPIDALDLSCLSQFDVKILCELRKNVQAGHVVSYGELARLAGAPRSARAVGNAMRRNPFPLFFPCHRVVREDGGIGGFSGGKNLKRILLEKELIFFDIRDKRP